MTQGAGARSDPPPLDRGRAWLIRGVTSQKPTTPTHYELPVYDGIRKNHATELLRVSV